MSIAINIYFLLGALFLLAASSSIKGIVAGKSTGHKVVLIVSFLIVWPWAMHRGIVAYRRDRECLKK